jgi:hypothetical protein
VIEKIKEIYCRFFPLSFFKPVFYAIMLFSRFFNLAFLGV